VTVIKHCPYFENYNCARALVLMVLVPRSVLASCKGIAERWPDDTWHHDTK